MEIKNIFKNLPAQFKEEFFEELLSTKNFKLEPIISEGHASPPGFWYDQEKSELIILISGSASLEYDDGNIFQLNPGDFLIIPSHQKHRVEWTDLNQKTFWLALHY